MKVLHVATEFAPYYKLGGLGDVIGTLPKELQKLGLDVTVVVPHYKKLNKEGLEDKNYVTQVNFDFDNKREEVKFHYFEDQGLNVILVNHIERIHDYEKQAIAGDQKEVDHYAFFSRAVVDWLTNSDHAPEFDVVHLHDWHVGLIPHLFRLKRPESKTKFIFTIHNLGYHGFSEPELIKRLGMTMVPNAKADPFYEFDARYDHQLDLLLQALLTSDYITAVSPNYAREIQTPEYCQGLCQVLQIRNERIRGVLNGLDYQVWNPTDDEYLTHRYGLKSHSPEDLHLVLSARAKNKRDLKKHLGLSSNDEIPLLGFVGRLEPLQKGLDILYDLLINLMQEDTPFDLVMIGEGVKEWEEKFKQLADSHPEKISVNIMFDEKLAHQIYASSDIVLIPSKYEPCGLVQLMAMRYGAIPLARKTGGLKDTIHDGQTGFLFDHYSVNEFLKSLHRALNVYNFDKPAWNEMIARAMMQDFTWEKSAKEYLKIYREAAKI